MLDVRMVLEVNPDFCQCALSKGRVTTHTAETNEHRNTSAHTCFRQNLQPPPNLLTTKKCHSIALLGFVSFCLLLLGSARLEVTAPEHQKLALKAFSAIPGPRASHDQLNERINKLEAYISQFQSIAG